ncbi:MAG: proteasome subunit alpha, partial [Thermoplasmata archaeon]|nr:proteasome subunit alpha [Thermoplasmata archaeon]
IEYFEKNYKEGMSMNDAIVNGLKALSHSSEKKLNIQAVEIGVVAEDMKFKILPSKETEKYYSKIKEE